MATSPRERGVLILIVAVLVVVLGFVLLVVSGNTNRVGASGSNGPFSSLSGGAPSPTPSHTSSFSGRDPFGPFGGGSSPSPTPTTSPPPSPTGSPPSGPGGGSSTSIGGHTVVLDDIFTVSGVSKAQVEVDGVVYTVGLGQTFAGSFNLTSITGSCAGFLFGTQSFSLCETAQK